MNNGLHKTYSTSKNYYYKREINSIIEDERTSAVIHYYDI